MAKLNFNFLLLSMLKTIALLNTFMETETIVFKILWWTESRKTAFIFWGNII